MGGFGSANSFPSLSPGELRHWIEFLSPVYSVGLAGQIVSWAPSVPSVGGWTKIELIRGADLIRSGQETTQLNLTISMWWRDGVYVNQHIRSSSGAEYVILSTENVLLLSQILVINAQALGAQANQGG